jgi:deoxyribonuclease V
MAQGGVLAVSHVYAGLDAAYDQSQAQAACLLFNDWTAEKPTSVVTATVPSPENYEPGAFYKRELPVLLAVLRKIEETIGAIVVDGYVWLDHNGKPGLGARLHEALGSKIPVIGVAKTQFQGDCWSAEVKRGTSQRPLYVTAAGMPVDEAASAIGSMHGKHRIPTLLRQVDQVARQGIAQLTAGRSSA